MLMYLPSRICDVITLSFDTRFQFFLHCQIWFDVLYTFFYMFCTFNEFLSTPKKLDVMYPTTLNRDDSWKVKKQGANMFITWYIFPYDSWYTCIFEIGSIPTRVFDLMIKMSQLLCVYFYTPDVSGRIIVWRGSLSVRLSGRLSACWSVRKACKHDIDWTIPARTVKLGILPTNDKRTNPIDFQGHGWKVKVTS